MSQNDHSEPEDWRPVIDFESRYRVSSLGRVWSVRSGKFLAAAVGSYGHHRLTLTKDGSVQLHYYVHRLVLEAFVGSQPPGMQCCHGDGNPSNNRLSNLRWDTSMANSQDAKRHGTFSPPPRLVGSSASYAKLNEAKVRDLRRRVDAGESLASVARDLGVTIHCVFRAYHRMNWAHVA